MQKALEAAKAVNSLLQFSSKDNKALLEVMQDYFLQPEDESPAQTNSDFATGDESDNDNDWMEGMMYSNTSLINL